MDRFKKMEIPHSLVIIVAVMFLACILTYIIPAGSYDRVKLAGKTVVNPTTFHYVKQSPVNPLTILNFIYLGLNKAGKIIFALMCAGGGLGVVLKTNALQGAAGSLSQKVKGKGQRMGRYRRHHGDLCFNLRTGRIQLLDSFRNRRSGHFQGSRF